MNNKFLKKAQKDPVPSAKKGRGLGRGLDGLLAAPAQEAAAPVLSKPIPAIGGTPLELKIAEIERSPYQPRREFKAEELREGLITEIASLRDQCSREKAAVRNA